MAALAENINMVVSLNEEDRKLLLKLLQALQTSPNVTHIDHVDTMDLSKHKHPADQHPVENPFPVEPEKKVPAKKEEPKREEPAKTYTEDDIRKKIMALNKKSADLKAKAKELLNGKYGADKLSSLDPSKYVDFVSDLEALTC